MPRNIIPADNEISQQHRQDVLKTNVEASEAMRENVRLRQESVVLRKECQHVFFGGRNRSRPDSAMVHVLLAEAERNVTVCDEIVERQRRIINELESDGRDGNEARSALHALLNTQALNVLTRDRLLGILSK